MVSYKQSEATENSRTRKSEDGVENLKGKSKALGKNPKAGESTVKEIEVIEDLKKTLKEVC